MKFTKTILIIFLFITRLNLLYSQSLLKQVLPPSPNAASLGKFANFPVNLYNGVPQIDIPIWTIDQWGMKVPVSLSYHAGGIQVAEVPSWVGLGWTLNAGGVITRSIQGIPDDGNGGFLVNPNLPLPECTSSLGSGDAAYDYFEAVTRQSNDTESDTMSNHISVPAYLLNINIPKATLSNLPQWFVGKYGRSIAMKGANKYTSVLSIQMRRLGWQHGGRIIGDVSAVAAFTSLAVDNGYYYNDIIQGKQSFDQVQEHYDDVTLSPIFWIYKRIEPWLISLGEPKK